MSMNIFRPYHSQPQFDARGRLTGVDRYQEVLGRDWKRFFFSGLGAVLGFAPFATGCAFAVLSQSILILLPACVVGGAIAGPFLACLYDTMLRALRNADGDWWGNYKKALAQNWKSSILPGILTFLFLGTALFTGMLFFWAQVNPSVSTLVVYAVSWLLFLVLVTLYWPQLVLFEQSNRLRLRNVLLFFAKYFWATVGAALLQLAFWLLIVLFAPLSLFLVPLVGTWFALFIALFLLYDKMDEAFGIEAGIRAHFPEQVAPDCEPDCD
jgi:hypothetical protein